MVDNRFSRRRYLQAVTVAGASGLIAGCQTDSNGAATTPSNGADGASSGVQKVEVPDAEPQQTAEPEGWATKWSEYLDIGVLGTFDSSGDAAWDKSEHPHVYVTTNGPGYSGRPSEVENPGVAVLDADTHEVVATRQYEFDFTPFETHGSAVSPDGNWFYIPTGNAQASDQKTSGRLLIINSETLKLDTLLVTSSSPHHIKTFERWDGKSVTLAYTFTINIAGYKAISAGSGIWIMDPQDDHKVIGGARSEDFQAEPYLSFPHPDGKHLYTGCNGHFAYGSDVPTEGIWAVVDMETWEVVDWNHGGGNPIWCEFTADGRYAFMTNGHEDFVYKHDTVNDEMVGESASAVHGVYGCRLNANEDKLYTVGKGESSHNLGKTLGLINPEAMGAVNHWAYGCVRGDHALINPFNPTELWISCNANQVDVVWDTQEDQLKASIKKSGSSHNGAFVDYSGGSGEVLFDQAGWHGSAKERHMEDLGVSEVVEWHGTASA